MCSCCSACQAGGWVPLGTWLRDSPSICCLGPAGREVDVHALGAMGWPQLQDRAWEGGGVVAQATRSRARLLPSLSSPGFQESLEMSLGAAHIPSVSSWFGTPGICLWRCFWGTRLCLCREEQTMFRGNHCRLRGQINAPAPSAQAGCLSPLGAGSLEPQHGAPGCGGGALPGLGWAAGTPLRVGVRVRQQALSQLLSLGHLLGAGCWVAGGAVEQWGAQGEGLELRTLGPAPRPHRDAGGESRAEEKEGEDGCGEGPRRPPREGPQLPTSGSKPPPGLCSHGRAGPAAAPCAAGPSSPRFCALPPLGFPLIFVVTPLGPTSFIVPSSAESLDSRGLWCGIIQTIWVYSRLLAQSSPNPWKSLSGRSILEIHKDPLVIIRDFMLMR